MAKVKKMAFGGMGKSLSAGMGQKLASGMALKPSLKPAVIGSADRQKVDTSAPPGAIKPQQLTPSQAKAMEMQRTTSNLSAAPTQSALMGANRPPGTAMSPPVKTGPVAPAGSAEMQNAAMKAYEQQKNMPSTTTAGPQSAQTGGIKLVNNPLESLTRFAAKRGFMKKGGAVKASKMGKAKQAKPSMSSASSRGDGIAQRGKTKGRIV